LAATALSGSGARRESTPRAHRPNGRSDRRPLGGTGRAPLDRPFRRLPSLRHGSPLVQSHGLGRREPDARRFEAPDRSSRGRSRAAAIVCPNSTPNSCAVGAMQSACGKPLKWNSPAPRRPPSSLRERSPTSMQRGASAATACPLGGGLAEVRLRRAGYVLVRVCGGVIVATPADGARMLVCPSSHRTRTRGGSSWSTSSITPARLGCEALSDSTTILSPT
jgi:hypothetical protein